jgi:excinuclease ABC subunit C
MYIEGLDISNIQGEMAVGSVVSFVDGLPNRAGYRNYRINAVDGIDDYGMMSELVSRRIRKGSLPDLFVIDGGKGHLSAVKRVFDLAEDEPVPEVISIAKPDRNAGERYEKIYIPGRKNALSLKPDNPVFKTLIQVRDEAHRRAVSYHRSLRTKKLKQSELDLIPGIGKKRKGILVRNFKDIEEISKLNIKDLAGIPGIGEAVAKEIVNFFEKEKPGHH